MADTISKIYLEWDTIHDLVDVLAEKIITNYPNIDPNNCVMIGDRNYDIIGAQANQIDSIGVLYGYGSSEEFKEANPTYIAETITDLRKILL